MRIGSCLFLLGILTLMQFREIPSLPSGAFLLFSIILASLRYRLLLPAIWYFSGFFWALMICHSILEKSLPTELEWVDITVRGTVVSLPTVRDRHISFELYVTELIDHKGIPASSPGKVRLNWYHTFDEILPGQTLDLTVRLKRPHGFMNPHGFDYEAWLFQQRIRATGYVRANNNQETMTERKSSIHSLRYNLRKKLEPLLVESPVAGLVTALVLGDRSHMTNAQWQVLTSTGTSHLLAISGLHIGLVAGFAFLLVRRIWPLSSLAANIAPATRIAALFSLSAAAFYAALAGFTVPTQRALTMIAVVIVFGVIYRRIAGADVLAIALLVVLIIDPLAVLSSGFWLSFAAVFIILFSLTSRNYSRNHRLLRRWGRVQICIFTGLIPVLGFWFNQVPISSLLANAVAIPWVSFVSVPMVIVGTVLLIIHEATGSIVLQLGALSLEILWPFLEYLSSLNILLLPLPQPSVAVLLAAIAGTAMILMPAGVPGKWLGVICLLPLLFPKPADAGFDGFEFTVLDTGQGLAAIIRTPNYLLLYDTGPGFSSGFNAGRAVILPLLKSTGQRHVDTIVISHSHNDHTGGLQDILENTSVGEVLAGNPGEIDVPQAQQCIAGQKWIRDGILFELLHPKPGNDYSKNDGSCVLKVSHGRHAVLLPGDIERRGERDLLENYPDSLRADVLVAPHHGSSTSSSHAFVRAVSPEYVIIPSGYLNRFQLPKQDIIDRYNEYGVKTLITARDGAVTARFVNDGLLVVKEREKSSKFWNNRP